MNILLTCIMHMELEIALELIFDPVTGKLWDTENGPQFGNEINMIEPGFNSGSDMVYGIWEADEFGDR